jgi:hypothetical protein
MTTDVTASHSPIAPVHSVPNGLPALDALAGLNPTDAQAVADAIANAASPNPRKAYRSAWPG